MSLSAWTIYPALEKNDEFELSELATDAMYTVRQVGMEAEHSTFSVVHVCYRDESVWTELLCDKVVEAAKFLCLD